MDKDIFLDQFGHLAQGPDGVKKLRDLILQLAVQGKLVEQDPNDEPASALLGQIEDVKKRLEDEGKIRKKGGIATTAIKERFPIPNSWAWSQLGTIGRVVGGGTPKKIHSEYFSDNGIPWLTPADLYGLKGKYISKGKTDVSELGLQKSSAQMMPKGSVLFSSRAPIGYVAIAENDLSTNQGFKSCVPYLIETSEYIYRYLQSSIAYIEGLASGTTFLEVSGKVVSSVPIPLPPLAEQKRIVGKVDELMALCDELEAAQTTHVSLKHDCVASTLHHLTEATEKQDIKTNWSIAEGNFNDWFDDLETVKNLRATILQLAVQGKLVEQDPSEEPASALLEQLWADAGNKRKSEINLTSQIWNIPACWEWTNLENLTNRRFKISYGVLVPGPDTANGVPFVRLQDLHTTSPSQQPSKTIAHDVESKYERTRLCGGEILLGVVGSIGKLGIVPESWIGANIARAVARIMPSERISSRYLLLALQSPYLQSRFIDATRTLAQPTLNIGLVKESAVPLPPLAEQKRIVAKVDELMTLCDQLEEQIMASEKLNQDLMASLVHHMTAAA